MKFLKTFLLLITLLVSSGIFSQNIKLEEITANKFEEKSTKPTISSENGLYYYQTNNNNSAIFKYEYSTGNIVKTLFDTKKTKKLTIDKFDGFLISPDEKKILVYKNKEQIYRRSFNATYYYYDVNKNTLQYLSKNTNKQKIPTFSHSGNMLAYVSGNNIWLVDFKSNKEIQVTKDGKYNSIINGSTDWVYEEEFAKTKLLDFSLDDKFLAFIHKDESKVPKYSFVKYEGKLYPKEYKYKYPKAGEINSSVECHIFDINSKKIKKINLHIQQTSYINFLKFTPYNNNLALGVLNRNQNKFDLYFTDPHTGKSKLTLTDNSRYYIDEISINSLNFLTNSFTYISDKDGYSQIYLYKSTGKLIKKLTDKNYDITSILAIDNKQQTLFYEAPDESPLKRSVFKIDLKNYNTTKISKQSGYNNAKFSNNGKFFINEYSNGNTPKQISVNDANGKTLRILENNNALAKILSSKNIPKKEFITIPAADKKTMLNAEIIKPINFDSNKKYPLVIIQYSGPNSQQVLDKYNFDWRYALVKEGFIVATVDGRGTAARGERFRKQTYMKLGIIESDDQVAAAKYFASLRYVNKDNIGIWGWSFGGYNVLMSMSRGNGIFKAGVAIAPVTDWRFYDSIYTERYMRTPQENKEGYDNGSPIKLANKLKGNLLIMHGTADDNVHLQNSIEYTRALINSNKQIEMFIYPDKNHYIYGGNTRQYLYKKVINFFKTNLR